MKVVVSACLLGENCKYSVGTNQDPRLTEFIREQEAIPVCPGAAIALERATQEGAGLAILQPRSPSCGAKQVYDGTFSGRKIAGMGVFARLLAENGFRILEPEDLP